MNPERSDERAAEDRMSVLLADKARIEREINELKRNRQPVGPNRIKTALIVSLFVIIAFGLVALAGAFNWQPISIHYEQNVWLGDVAKNKPAVESPEKSEIPKMQDLEKRETNLSDETEHRIPNHRFECMPAY